MVAYTWLPVNSRYAVGYVCSVNLKVMSSRQKFFKRWGHRDFPSIFFKAYDDIGISRCLIYPS